MAPARKRFHTLTSCVSFCSFKWLPPFCEMRVLWTLWSYSVVQFVLRCHCLTLKCFCTITPTGRLLQFTTSNGSNLGCMHSFIVFLLSACFIEYVGGHNLKPWIFLLFNKVQRQDNVFKGYLFECFVTRSIGLEGTSWVIKSPYYYKQICHAIFFINYNCLLALRVIFFFQMLQQEWFVGQK